MRRERADDGGDALPLVALVGRPNVGKSSLFNRMVGGRPALVHDEPGITRDRRYGVCAFGAARFRVVDTGGLDPSAEGILGAVRGQTLRAVDEADLLVLVVDARTGADPVDRDVARLLRRAGKPLLVAANKVDTAAHAALAGDAYTLGIAEVFPLSASHGRGLPALIERIDEELSRAAPTAHRVSARAPAPDQSAAAAAPEATPGDPDVVRLALCGKPNVGKSSLVNRLLGEERVLVHDRPGTTRDPVDSPLTALGRRFVLVDTAGLRRRRSIDTLPEAVAAKMSRDQIERADVVALVIDAEAGVSAEDAKLAAAIEESGRAVLIALNKIDRVDAAALKKRREAVRETLRFLPYAPVLDMSARTGRGVEAILREALRVHAEWSRRVSTGQLNQSLKEYTEHRPPPADPRGRPIRLYYAAQTGVRPPTFHLSCNNPAAVPYTYRRYLVNRLRETHGFAGTPLRLVFRAHRSKGRR